MIRAVCSLVVITAVSSQISQSPILPSSPCPEIFTYEPTESNQKPEPGKWYGNVNLYTDIPLYSLWLNIIVDSKADILGNWVGEVTTIDNLNFKIENTDIKISPNEPFRVRFFLQYNPKQQAPKVQSILFNGREICNANVFEPIPGKSNGKYYAEPNRHHGGSVLTTTTVRSTTTASTKNVYDRFQTKNPYKQETTTKANYWPQVKETTQATTERNRSKYGTTSTPKTKSTTSNWAWNQPKIENNQYVRSTETVQTKKKENQTQTQSSNSGVSAFQRIEKDNNIPQSIYSPGIDNNKQSIGTNRYQPASEVLTKTENIQRKSEKLQISTERISPVVFGGTSYSKPQSQIDVVNNQQRKSENKQEINSGDNTKRLWTEVAALVEEEISVVNKQTSVLNKYSNGQAWTQPAVESNHETRTRNTQDKSDYKSQVSTVDQYKPDKNQQASRFEDIDFVVPQNVRPTYSQKPQVPETKVTTDDYQGSRTRPQVKPVEFVYPKPVQTTNVDSEKTSVNTALSASSGHKPSTWSQEQVKIIFGTPNTSYNKNYDRNRNVEITTVPSLSGHELTTTRPPVRKIQAPVIEDFDNISPKEEEHESYPSGGLPTLYIPNIAPESTCGKVVIKSPPYLPPGSSTSEGQWPWQTAIYQQQSVNFKYICGGTLVSHRHVITAAHCVTRKNSRRVVKKNTLTVYLGKYNLRTSVDGVQVKFVNKIIVHPEYNATIFSRDLAILELRDPVTYSDWVRPVCLWPETEIDLFNIVGKKGSVVGWGFEVTGTAKEELSLLEMPVVDQETCLNSYIEFYEKFTSDYTYCAGYNKDGTAVCNGDSGGGMVFKRGSSWYLRGLASLSVARQNAYRCDPKHFVIFTDIAKFLPWIEDHIDSD
ncbi:uncharacterized protein LOC142981779 [Anticarsia gemmatalis]|uniref:uncharacterized protein LOC142981779 n=1 Tax=Anticarsia gemmatalis TaxID=129554 RepID=UPI003F764138